MKENEESQIQGFKLPPAWCSSLCRNAMNQKCIEDCAAKRDCSGFELMSDINLMDLPRFPINEIGKMTREEKLTVIAVYIAKTTDHLQGVSDEPVIRRPHHDHSRSVQVSQDQQSEAILFSAAEAITSLETRKEHPSTDE